MLIYKATFPNGKSYIGQTIISFRLRQKQHINSSLSDKRKTKDNYIFHKAIRKYGWENVKWEILEDDIQNSHILDEKETFNILKYDTYLPNGYNMTLGGENAPMLGQKHTEKTKIKMSINHADVSGKNNPFYGKKHNNYQMNQKIFDRVCVICGIQFKGLYHQVLCADIKCKRRYNVLKTQKYQAKKKLK